MSKRFLSRRVSDTNVGWPTGTVLCGFVQTLAPPGWVKSSTHNDKAIRIVSGTPSTSGSVAFSTVFGLTAVDGFTLLDADITGHVHTIAHTHAVTALTVPTNVNSSGTNNYAGAGSAGAATTGIILGNTDASSAANSGSIGGSTDHAHAIDLQVNTVDVIICTKN